MRGFPGQEDIDVDVDLADIHFELRQVSRILRLCLLGSFGLRFVVT